MLWGAPASGADYPRALSAIQRHWKFRPFGIACTGTFASFS